MVFRCCCLVLHSLLFTLPVTVVPGGAVTFTTVILFIAHSRYLPFTIHANFTRYILAFCRCLSYVVPLPVSTLRFHSGRYVTFVTRYDPTFRSLLLIPVYIPVTCYLRILFAIWALRTFVRSDFVTPYADFHVSHIPVDCCSIYHVEFHTYVRYVTISPRYYGGTVAGYYVLFVVVHSLRSVTLYTSLPG